MPAPLAQPTRWMRLPPILKEAEAVLGRVSVVQMASENSAKERAEGRWWRATMGKPRKTFSSGSGTPITPVEQTTSSCGWQPRCLAASETVRKAAAWPAVPVAQLALPALTTNPRMRPLEAFRCWREISTGAATTRFCVKTAAAEAFTSLDKIARSSAPVFFRPQAVAAKRKPRGRDDSESAWFKVWIPESLAWRTAKQPPVLHTSDEDIAGWRLARGHGLAPSLSNRSSKSVMAARTEAGAVPPETFLAARADATFRPSAKSGPKLGESCCKISSGNSVQGLPTCSAARRTCPTRS